MGDRDQHDKRVFHVDPEGTPEVKPAEDEGGTQRPVISTMTFAHHVMSLNHLALVHLGETGESAPDLVMAAQVIDTLGMLKNKTVGNLDDEERRLLDTLLYELRVKYVQKARR
ncbi:MAG: DUF1844 domain-containing protein [Bradymonadia bacterium]